MRRDSKCVTKTRGCREEEIKDASKQVTIGSYEEERSEEQEIGRKEGRRESLPATS